MVSSLENFSTDCRRICSHEALHVMRLPNRLEEIDKEAECESLHAKLTTLQTRIAAYRPSCCQKICDLFSGRIFRIKKLWHTLPKVLEAVEQHKAILKAQRERREALEAAAAAAAAAQSQPPVTPLTPSHTFSVADSIIVKEKVKLLTEARQWLQNAPKLPDYHKATGYMKSVKTTPFTPQEVTEAIKYFDDTLEKLESENVPTPAFFHATGGKVQDLKVTKMKDVVAASTAGKVEAAAKKAIPKYAAGSELDIMESIIAEGHVQTTAAGMGLGAYCSNNDEFVIYGPITFAIDAADPQNRNAFFWPKHRDYTHNPWDKYNSIWIRVRMEIAINQKTIAFIIAPTADENAKINVNTVRERLKEINFDKQVLTRRVANIIRYAIDSVQVKRDLPGKDLNSGQDMWRRYTNVDPLDQGHPMPENYRHNIVNLVDDAWEKYFHEDQYKRDLQRALDLSKKP